MHARILMALAGIAPVDEIDGAVGTIRHLDAAEPRIAGKQDVGLVAADVAAPFALQAFDVHPPAVLIERQQPSAILRRPLLSQVNRHADVGVATAQPVVVAAGRARVGPAFARVEVPVVGVHVDRLVNE